MSEASAEDWANFAGEMMIPLWLSPTEMGNGSLYGPGTPFDTYEDYERFYERYDSMERQYDNEPVGQLNE